MATVFSDTFSDTDGVALAAHAPAPTGTGWTEHPSYASGSAVIQTNRAALTGNATNSCFYANDPPLTDSYTVTATLTPISLAGGLGIAGIIGHCQLDSNSLYLFRHTDSIGWQLYRIEAGTATLLTTNTDDLTLTLDQPYALSMNFNALGANHTTITCQVDGDTKISTTDVSALCSPRGYAGLRGLGTTTAGYHFDDFTVADVTPPAEGELDPYGGYNALPVAGKATGHFGIGQSGVYWIFTTPLGHAFWLRACMAVSSTAGGVYYAPCVETKYAGGSFREQCVKRLRSWGFNTLGEVTNDNYLALGAHGGSANPEKLPFIRLINAARYGGRAGLYKELYQGINTTVNNVYIGIFYDVFDAAFAARVADFVADFHGVSPDSVFGGHEIMDACPWLIGITPDDGDYCTGLGPRHEAAADQGKEHPHLGWVVAVTSPTQGAGYPEGYQKLYTDPLVYSKQAWADFLLERYGGASWTASTTWEGDGAGSLDLVAADTHLFATGDYIQLTSGPFDGEIRRVTGVNGSVVTVDRIYSSTVEVPFGTTSSRLSADQAATALAALNTAWGTSGYYTTFGTSATIHADEAIGTGDGATLTYPFTLDNLPDRNSLQIKVDGAMVAGDKMVWASASRIRGYYVSALIPNTAAGTIAYNTGVCSITFVDGYEPANGAAITATYRTGGWGAGSGTNGTGILDEDGSHAWISNDGYDMTGGNATCIADLDLFLHAFASKYFQAYHDARDLYLPNKLLFSPLAMQAGTRDPILSAAGEYLDAIISSGRPGPDTSHAWYQNAYNVSGLPIFLWTNFTANQDCALADPDAGWGEWYDKATQALRGAAYATDLAALMALMGTDGKHFIVGIDWWEWVDHYDAVEQMNFGLVTNGSIQAGDNAYDGVEARTATGVDAWGYAVGGESADYGNFLGAVTTAHASILSILQGNEPPPPPGSSTLHGSGRRYVRRVKYSRRGAKQSGTVLGSPYFFGLIVNGRTPRRKK